MTIGENYKGYAQLTILNRYGVCRLGETQHLFFL